MIELSHIYKVYSGTVQALSDVNLKIEKGEFVLLTGPSGAGKTTLFRMITCYDKPTSGKIIVANQDLSTIHTRDIPLIRRRIGVVFQDFRLLKNRTVAENVALPLELMSLRESELNHRVNDILDQVGLRYKGSYYPEQLSGGEQQRVAIARALVAKPGLLIADEPTGNLDQALSNDIMELFARINAQGTTVFIATHNPLFITKANKRVVSIEKGQIREGLPSWAKKEEFKKPAEKSPNSPTSWRDTDHSRVAKELL